VKCARLFGKIFYQIPRCWWVLSPTRKETSYSDQTLTFASHSKKIQKVIRPTRSPQRQWPLRWTKNGDLSIVFFSWVGLRTYQHPCIVCIEMEELVFLMFGIKVYGSSRIRACHDSYGFLLQLHSPNSFCTNSWIFMKFDMDIQQVHWRLPHLHTFNLVPLIILSWQKLNFRTGSNTNSMEDLCCRRS